MQAKPDNNRSRMEQFYSDINIQNYVYENGFLLNYV